MYLLDSDHLSLLERGGVEGMTILNRLRRLLNNYCRIAVVEFDAKAVEVRRLVSLKIPVANNQTV